MKKILTLLMMCWAISAAAQNDSIKVRMDFNANPWNLPTSEMRGWGNYADENGCLPKTTNFDIDVNGETLRMVLTPSDLDETDYDNCMVKGEDYDDGNKVKTILFTRIGSTMKFIAPASLWMAKVSFNIYRRWSSGGLYSGPTTNNEQVWGKDSVKVREYPGGVTVQCWSGDSVEWSLPACTGQTYLHHIDFWLLPRQSASVQEVNAEEAATVDVVTAEGIVVRKNAPRKQSLKGLRKGLYIVNKKKYTVK